MGELLEILQSPWALRALFASSMVGIMCGVLGCFIVLRNMALIGDALSHAILPGVVIAFVIVGYSEIGFFAGSVLAGLLTAIGITWIQQNVNTKNDAAIGIVFTAMFAIGVIGISNISRNEGVHLDLKDFLFGNILGVSNTDLYLTAFTTLYVLLSVAIFYRYLFATTFQEVIAQTMGISVKYIHYFLMLLLSFAVVASLQTVGVILVVAMLITPASTALLLSNRLEWVLFLAGLIGLLASVVGLISAILLETPPGPAMAVVAFLFYMIAVFFAPTKGLLFKFFQKRKLQTRIQLEDTLKQALRLQQAGNLTPDNLLNRLGFNRSILQKHLQTLKIRGLVQFDKEQLQLTNEGKESALQLVRAHRLWETFLVQRIGLTEEQIHEDAERYEHLLTEELLDEVDRSLGFPDTDPHGAPIPTKKNKKGSRTSNAQIDVSKQKSMLMLYNLRAQQNAQIDALQQNDAITKQLWQLGLLPNNPISIQKKGKQSITIEQNGKTFEIPAELGNQVQVSLL